MDIQQARKLAGFSRGELSKYLGIPMTTIDNWDYHGILPPVWVERLVINELLRIAELKAKGKFNGIRQLMEIQKMQNDREFFKLEQEQEKKKESRQK